jgi:hypothetical protein
MIAARLLLETPPAPTGEAGSFQRSGAAAGRSDGRETVVPEAPVRRDAARRSA